MFWWNTITSALARRGKIWESDQITSEGKERLLTFPPELIDRDSCSV
jgi:hypothetical protein